MSGAPAPAVPPANDPGVLSRLLKSVNSVYSNPNDAGLLGMAQGFGAAAAPHMLTPVSMGQAFGMADQGAQQMRSASLQNAITQQALLPYQVMRTHALESSFRDAMNPKLPAHQRAAAAYRVDSLMGWNAASDPTVANRLAQIKAGYQPVTQGPGATLTTAAKVAQGAGQTAHGAVPEASVFNPRTGALAQAAGAPGVLAANAANKAGGAAAATLPYQLAQHYVTRPPGVAGGTLGQAPVGFRPVMPTAPNNAAQQAAMQKMIGLQVGLTNAAQAAGRPGPLPTTQTPPVPPAALQAPGTPQGAPLGQAPAPAAAPPQAAPAQAQGASPQTMLPGSGPPIAPAAAPAGGIYSAGRGLLGYQMTKAQIEQANQVETGYQKEAGDAVDTLTQVKELQAATHNFSPGQFAEARIKGLQWLNSIGVISPAQMRELGSAQEGTKMSIQLQSTLVRSLGSREAAQVFATLGRGVPNLTLSPDGFQKMAAYMNGMARYKQARAARAQSYYNAQNVNGVNSVKSQFIANSNPAYFIIASAPLAVQREMVAQMGAKAHSFLAGWAKAAAQGWAPSTTTYASQP
jgi:hypothetical protein